MKLILYVILTIPVVIVLWFGFLSVISRNEPVLGLVDGRLSACPDTPNCVCSEYENVSSYISPIAFSTDAKTAWLDIRNGIIENGGEIKVEQDEYLHAVFTTPLFRFIDDVELRLERRNRHIHIRSASRVGHSDLGVNQSRVEALRMSLSRD